MTESALTVLLTPWQWATALTARVWGFLLYGAT